VNPANPNVDIVSFGLRIVFHDAAQPIRWTTPRPFLAPGLKWSRHEPVLPFLTLRYPEEILQFLEGFLGTFFLQKMATIETVPSNR
jgi:hypothetical protein